MRHLDLMSDEQPRPHAERIKAMEPTAKHGRVIVVDPPNAALEMSPDHAEISAMRLLDAADRARRE